MAAADPSRRATAASIAALTRWSKQDTKTGTAAARRGMWHKFLEQVDPDGLLPEPERQARAKRAQTAHMKRLALASAAKRRRTA